MSEMTQEEANATINETLTRLGQAAARRVMGRVVHELLEPDEMEALVDRESKTVQAFFESRGVIPHNVDIAVGIFRYELIREGKRITIALDMREGTA